MKSCPLCFQGVLIILCIGVFTIVQNEELSVEPRIPRLDELQGSGVVDSGRTLVKRNTDGQCHRTWIWNKFSGKCVKLFHTHYSWFQARETCKKFKGDLVTILSNESLKFIADNILTTSVDPWIGLNDRKTEGHYKWLDSDDEVNNEQLESIVLINDVKDCAFLHFTQMISFAALYQMANCMAATEFICETNQGTEPCPNNMYGEACAKMCSLHCAGPDKACDSTTGVCLHGCMDGYTGDKCVQRPTSEPVFSPSGIISLASGALCAVLLIAIAARKLLEDECEEEMNISVRSPNNKEDKESGSFEEHVGKEQHHVFHESPGGVEDNSILEQDQEEQDEEDKLEDHRDEV